METYKHYCTCGGYAGMSERAESAHPHMTWCAQYAEYEARFAREVQITNEIVDELIAEETAQVEIDVDAEFRRHDVYVRMLRYAREEDVGRMFNHWNDRPHRHMTNRDRVRWLVELDEARHTLSREGW